MRISLVFLFIGLSCLAVAQQKKDRYNFAATYFGVEVEVNSQRNTFSSLNESGELEQQDLPSTLSPRLLIGGTHFWNHADFYISFPIANIRLAGSENAAISNDVFTGFRLLPFALRQDKAKPFFGVGFNSKEFRQEGANGKSQLYTNWQWYFEGGLTYVYKKRHLLGLEARYFSKNKYNPYYDRVNSSSVEVSPFSFSLSYKKLFDFSAGFRSEKSKQFFTKLKSDLTEKKQLNTYSIGVGMSAFIPFEKIDYASRNEFFNDQIDPSLFPEIGVAYYHHNLDASARISYRPILQEEKAYDYEFSLRNHSIAIEAFKFIGDYHGFVPFVGPYLSQNYYHLTESDGGKKVTDISECSIGYGLSFGWDIRFTETDYLILRTNMRYTPDFNQKLNGLNYSGSGLEFNFIQLVYYPQRHQASKNLTL